jgi:DtxR family Mn-dependent transcriptional regulator
MKSPKPAPGADDTSSPRLSMGVENYLLSIYQLQEEDVRVTTTQLADRLRQLPEGEVLGATLPSVGAMLRRMVRDGLVETTRSKDVVLTQPGLTAAESMVRRHRLAKRMVVDLLGVPPHMAHAEAHRLEHAISPYLADKIDERLGHPTTCPFGHPIPGSGYTPRGDAAPLSQMAPGATAVVDRVPDQDQELLQYFVENGLMPGRHVVVVEAAPYRGVVKLDCDGAEVVVSFEVAERIWARSLRGLGIQAADVGEPHR